MSIRDIVQQEALATMESLKYDVTALEKPKQRALADKLNRQGITHRDLAEFFGVTPRTIYDWIRNEREHYQEELEAKTGLEVIIENLADLTAYEKLCMREASALGQDQIEIDVETGKRRIKAPTTANLVQKAKFIELARKFREMQIGLLTKTGVIPSAPEKAYHKLGDHKIDEEQELNPQKVDRETLAESVLDKLRRQNAL